MKFAYLSALTLALASPTLAADQPPTAAEDLTMCDALMTEMDVISARTEGQMIAMGKQMAAEAGAAVAENKAYNASQMITGRLNWVAPGLGTVLDEINKSVKKASQKRRELRIERERVAATMSVQQAVDRMVALSNELVLNDCAAL